MKNDMLRAGKVAVGFLVIGMVNLLLNGFAIRVVGVPPNEIGDGAMLMLVETFVAVLFLIVGTGIALSRMGKQMTDFDEAPEEEFRKMLVAQAVVLAMFLVMIMLAMTKTWLRRGMMLNVAWVRLSLGLIFIFWVALGVVMVANESLFWLLFYLV